MAIEREWRFLVTKLPALPDVPSAEVLQAYLGGGPFSVRVRVIRGKGYLTIKTEMKGAAAGPGPLARYEFEYEIPVADAREMIALSNLRVEKRRYDVPGGIELDIFEGKLKGLVIAEIEVSSDSPPPASPDGWQWLDITNDRRYGNRSLAEDGLPPSTPLARIGK